MEKWFVEDFSMVSGIEEESIEKMEQLTLFQLLEFRANVSKEEFEKEMKDLKTASGGLELFMKREERGRRSKRPVEKCPSL